MPAKSSILCDDWGCPAKASCARAFWRSREYAALSTAETRRFDRAPDAESCTAYAYDEPKSWLALQPGVGFFGGFPVGTL